MMHEMNLQPKPFESIKSGRKIIEMRLNDEKRKGIKIGDVIMFINNENGEVMLVEVINLYPFKNFEELYAHFDKKDLGYLDDEKADPSDMEIYYPKDRILKYGVLGIEIMVL